MRFKLAIVVGLALVGILGAGCHNVPDFDTSLRAIVEPYGFNVVEWEIKTISQEVSKWLAGADEEVGDETSAVIEYFSAVERIRILRSEIEAVKSGNEPGDSSALEAELNTLQGKRDALKETVETVLEKQIREALVQEDIFNPVDELIKSQVGFPPVNFSLEKPPHLLVISPRDRIESIREVTLRQNLSLEEMAEIEAEADKLGVSSIVLGLGGLGATYPTFVTNEAGLGFTLSAAIEEWVHQYLFFKPLGFLYSLDLIGIARNYEVAVMNETLASMVSDEIGVAVFQERYSPYENGVRPKGKEDPESFFNREMREIRRTVDLYLAAGEIEQAEEFMEQKRQYLVAQGYQIRKLNQAYFAFYGTYADDPASVSPIGVEMEKLRDQSTSLKDFLDTAAALTSRDDLTGILK